MSIIGSGTAGEGDTGFWYDKNGKGVPATPALLVIVFLVEMNGTTNTEQIFAIPLETKKLKFSLPIPLN